MDFDIPVSAFLHFSPNQSFAVGIPHHWERALAVGVGVTAEGGLQGGSLVSVRPAIWRRYSATSAAYPRSRLGISLTRFSRSWTTELSSRRANRVDSRSLAMRRSRPMAAARWVVRSCWRAWRVALVGVGAVWAGAARRVARIRIGMVAHWGVVCRGEIGCYSGVSIAREVGWAGDGAV